MKEKYIKRYNIRYNCPSPNAKELWNIFKAECERLGLLYDMKTIIRHFKAGYDKQLTLF